MQEYVVAKLVNRVTLDEFWFSMRLFLGRANSNFRTKKEYDKNKKG